MAVKISGTTVIDNNRQLSNIVSLDTTTVATIQGVAGATANGEVAIAYRGLANTYYDDPDYMPTSVYKGDVTDNYVNPYALGVFNKTEASDYFVNIMGSQTVSDMQKYVTLGVANVQGAIASSSWAPANNSVFLEKTPNGSTMHVYRDLQSRVVIDRYIVGVPGWWADTYVVDYGTDSYAAMTHFNDVSNTFVVFVADTDYNTVNRYQWKEYGANTSNYTSELNYGISSGIGKIKAACVADVKSTIGTYYYFAIGEGGLFAKTTGSAGAFQSQITFNGVGSPFDTTNAQYIDHLTYVSSNSTHITLKGLDFGYNSNSSKGTAYTLVYGLATNSWTVTTAGTSTWDGSTTWNTYASTTTYAYHYDPIRAKYFFSFEGGGSYNTYNCVSTDGYTWVRQNDLNVSAITSIKCDTNSAYMLATSACTQVLVTTSDYSTYNIDIYGGSSGGGLAEYKPENQRFFFGFDSYFAGDYFNDNNGWMAYDNQSTGYTIELPLARSLNANTGDYVVLNGYSYDTSTNFYANPSVLLANTIFETPTSPRYFVKVK